MMILTLIPQWGRPEGVIAVAGDVLTVNGTAYDLSPIPEGGEAEVALAPGQEHVLIGAIRRIGGVIHATLITHLGPDAAGDQPGAPWVVEAEDGVVTVPYLVREGIQ